MWSKSPLLSKPEITALHHVGKWEKQWVFYRCQVNGVVYQCEKYKRVTARNNFSVSFNMNGTLTYGFIKTFIKVAEGCNDVMCTELGCQCEHAVRYWAIIEILDVPPCQLSNGILKHIVLVMPTNRLVVVKINSIQEKCVCVDVSSGTWVCHLPNGYERD